MNAPSMELGFQCAPLYRSDTQLCVSFRGGRRRLSNVAGLAVIRALVDFAAKAAPAFINKTGMQLISKPKPVGVLEMDSPGKHRNNPLS